MTAQRQRTGNRLVTRSEQRPTASKLPTRKFPVQRHAAQHIGSENMTTPTAILISAHIFATASLFLFRSEMQTANNEVEKTHDCRRRLSVG
jgi:hypothetical protein